jgi:plastocyanin
MLGRRGYFAEGGPAASLHSGNPLATARALATSLLLALGVALALAGVARAGTCPQIHNKPGAIPHVNYQGVQHLTYCVPVSVQPGQNIIRFNSTSLFPSEPGYITRFDPELIYSDGTVPRVDVLHLHHAVWIVNGSPQFATGEEKTIVQTPEGFGWRSTPGDSWFLNDMIHDLTPTGANVYIVWRLDFVPDTSPAAATMKTVHTKWMDVSGPSPSVGISSPIYPVFDALRSDGNGKRYTFPDQAKGADRALIGPSQTWTPSQAVTLIQTAGHLHPGGLSTTLKVHRGDQHNTLFKSKAHYFEPAGAVSWDVSMGATPADWRVKLQPGDDLSVHATYDSKRADWYEVMGIMPVAVYNGTDVGGVDALSDNIPKGGVLTHTHLNENRHHGGKDIGLPDPRDLASAHGPFGQIGIDDYAYAQGDLLASGAAAKLPTVHAGHSLTFLNNDAAGDTYHTLTACKEPCNGDTGIAYPIANGPVTFDSGQLGFNSTGFGAPAIDQDTWQTPSNLKPGTYGYFCRVHPFMRGSFRVTKGN